MRQKSFPTDDSYRILLHLLYNCQHNDFSLLFAGGVREIHSSALSCKVYIVSHARVQNSKNVLTFTFESVMGLLLFLPMPLFTLNAHNHTFPTPFSNLVYLQRRWWRDEWKKKNVYVTIYDWIAGGGWCEEEEKCCNLMKFLEIHFTIAVWWESWRTASHSWRNCTNCFVIFNFTVEWWIGLKKDAK